jgi:hypothetical protein
MKKIFPITLAITALISCKKEKPIVVEENKTTNQTILIDKIVEQKYYYTHTYDSQNRLTAQICFDRKTNKEIDRQILVYKDGKIDESYFIEPDSDTKYDRTFYLIEADKITATFQSTYGVNTTDDRKKVGFLQNGKITQLDEYFYDGSQFQKEGTFTLNWTAGNVTSSSYKPLNIDCTVDNEYTVDTKKNYLQLIRYAYDNHFGEYGDSQNQETKSVEKDGCFQGNETSISQYTYANKYNEDEYPIEIIDLKSNDTTFITYIKK